MVKTAQNILSLILTLNVNSLNAALQLRHECLMVRSQSGTLSHCSIISAVIITDCSTAVLLRPHSVN